MFYKHGGLQGRGSWLPAFAGRSSCMGGCWGAAGRRRLQVGRGEHHSDGKAGPHYRCPAVPWWMTSPSRSRRMSRTGHAFSSSLCRCRALPWRTTSPKPELQLVKSSMSTLAMLVLIAQVSGFDLVDDESKPERRPNKHMPHPRDWTSKHNPGAPVGRRVPCKRCVQRPQSKLRPHFEVR